MLATQPAKLNAVRSIVSQLECDGLDWHRFEKESGCLQAATLFGPLISHWQESGLVFASDAGMELTLAGQFWQINLCQLLLEWLYLHAEDD